MPTNIDMTMRSIKFSLRFKYKAKPHPKVTEM